VRFKPTGAQEALTGTAHDRSKHQLGFAFYYVWLMSDKSPNVADISGMLRISKSVLNNNRQFIVRHPKSVHIPHRRREGWLMSDKSSNVADISGMSRHFQIRAK
jgi:hypothetical protein